MKFQLISIGEDCYHGVRDGQTIYDVWPYPGEAAYGASYHKSGGKFVTKQKTLKLMAKELEKRCCNPANFTIKTLTHGQP